MRQRERVRIRLQSAARQCPGRPALLRLQTAHQSESTAARQRQSTAATQREGQQRPRQREKRSRRPRHRSRANRQTQREASTSQTPLCASLRLAMIHPWASSRRQSRPTAVRQREGQRESQRLRSASPVARRQCLMQLGSLLARQQRPARTRPKFPPRAPMFSRGCDSAANPTLTLTALPPLR